MTHKEIPEYAIVDPDDHDTLESFMQQLAMKNLIYGQSGFDFEKLEAKFGKENCESLLQIKNMLDKILSGL